MATLRVGLIGASWVVEDCYRISGRDQREKNAA